MTVPPNSTPATLGAFLRQQRKQKGWTQEEAAKQLERLGHHSERNTIYRHESGIATPDIKTIYAYAQLFKCDSTLLFDLAARITPSVDETTPNPTPEQPPTGEAIPTTTTPQPRHRVWRIFATITPLTILTAWLALRHHETPRVTAAITQDHRLIAFANDEPLWHHEFPNLHHTILPPLLRDVDHDGHTNIIFAFRPQPPETETSSIQCYDHNGTLQWHVMLGRAQTVGDRTFTPYYVPQLVEWIHTPTTTYLLVIARHHRWYPTQVLLLDPTTGAIISEYWHPGYLHATTTLDLNKDKRPELLLSGINNPGNGPGHPIIAVLNLPFQPPKHHNNHFGPHNSKEHTYLILPRPDFINIHTNLAVVTELERQPNNHVLAGVANHEDTLYFYEFDEHLKLIDIYDTDTMIRIHDALAQDGQLDHRYTPEERLDWRNIQTFPTAPNANSDEVRTLFVNDR